MKVTDPKPYLDAIDRERLRDILGRRSQDGSNKGLVYVEPSSSGDDQPSAPAPAPAPVVEESTNAVDPTTIESENVGSASPDVKRGKIQVLGDFIDTDALAPAEILATCITNAEFGEHCLEHTHPKFRARAAEGYNIVVAGTAFGCGSSREDAVSALLGCGVQAVIAKSFAFIYGRNAPNLGLLGIVIQDDSFYKKAKDGREIEVDLDKRVVRLEDEEGGEWKFEMSDMEKELISAGGVTSAFRKFGKRLFAVLTTPKGQKAVKPRKEESNCQSMGDVQW